MDTFEDDNPSNLYVIRRKLASLKPINGTSHVYEWGIGHYIVRMFFNPPFVADYIFEYVKNVQVDVYETITVNGDHLSRARINLTQDPLFCQYKPILYKYEESPEGHIVNMGDGHEMPIPQLCELIKYLYRLSNLSVFT